MTTLAPPVLTIHAPFGRTKPEGTHIGRPKGDKSVPGARGGHAETGSIVFLFEKKHDLGRVGGLCRQMGAPPAMPVMIAPVEGFEQTRLSAVNERPTLAI